MKNFILANSFQIISLQTLKSPASFGLAMRECQKPGRSIVSLASLNYLVFTTWSAVVSLTLKLKRHIQLC